MGFITSQSLSYVLSPWDVSHKRKSTQGKSRTLAEELCHRFSLDEIIAATHCFDHNLRIGQGTVGTVYKGYVKVPRHQTQVVAIKRFSPYYGTHEFREEVQLLCQLRHPNIISLIGFCEEKGERILVYEYMPNGTLSNYLHSRIGPVHPEGPLLWKQRLEICIALAAAIHHLHTGVKYAIVHRNMSCNDILLDERLVPKLSGFHRHVRGPPSLSKTLLIKELDVVPGTIGYIDPELLFSSGKLTEKFDVFSFGIVLTEVLCGTLRLILREYDGSSTLHDIIDPYLVGRVAPECLKKFINIAARCTRATGAERPTMGEVQVDLQYALALQESADADQERDTSGGDYTYNDETSFSEIHDIFNFRKYSIVDDDVSPPSPNSFSFSSCDHEGR